MSETLELIFQIAFFIFIIGGVLGIFVISPIYFYFKRRKEYNALEEPFEEQSEIITLWARVISKRSTIEYGKSVRFPTHKVAFYITVITDDNKQQEYSVFEETYNRFNENDVCKLVFENGNLIDIE